MPTQQRTAPDAMTTPDTDDINARIEAALASANIPAGASPTATRRLRDQAIAVMLARSPRQQWAAIELALQARGMALYDDAGHLDGISGVTGRPTYH